MVRILVKAISKTKRKELYRERKTISTTLNSNKDMHHSASKAIVLIDAEAYKRDYALITEVGIVWISTDKIYAAPTSVTRVCNDRPSTSLPGMAIGS